MRILRRLSYRILTNKGTLINNKNTIMKTFSLKENATEILAIIGGIIAITIIVLLFFVKVPKENEQLLNILGGVIVGSMTSPVYGYYFGQSKKRDIIPEAGQSTSITTQSVTKDVK